MAIRSKSRKRILIILIAAFVLVSGLGGLYWLGKARTAANLQQQRAEGLEAFSEGNYEAAVKPLSSYVGRNTDDLEALRAFAESLLALRERKPQRVRTAIATLRKIHEQDPSDLETKQELMQLYLEFAQFTEAANLAEGFLETDPDHAEALRIRGLVHLGMREPEQGLESLQRYLAVNPRDLDVQAAVLNLMQELERPPAALIEYATAFAEQHPDDAAGPWLVGLAHFLTGDRQQAFESARRAAEADLPDADLVIRVSRMFDALQQFALGTQVIIKHRELMTEGAEATYALHRLWEVGANDPMRELASNVDPGGRELVAQTVGLVALNQLRDAEAQERWLEELRSRAADEEPMAKSWLALVEAQAGSVSGKQFVAICRDALDEQERHPYFRGWLGDALAQQGLIGTAMEEWQKASEAAPAWYTPHVRSARSHLQMGSLQPALQHAVAAVRRAPNRPETIVVFLQTRTAMLEDADDPAYASVKADVQRIMEQQTVPELAPTWIRLVAMGGDPSELEQQVAKLLQDGQNLSADHLLQIEQIVASRSPELQQRISAHLTDKHGASANVIWRRALALGREGEVDAGRRLLSERLDTAPESQKLAAEIDLLRYDELTSDQSVADRWYRMSEQHPDSRVVQESAAESSDAWADLEQMRLILDRLRQVTGDDSVEWRLAMARWQMLQDTPVARDSAIELLTQLTRTVPGMVRPRLMLIEAHRRQGNHSLMLDHLTIASSMAPDNIDLKIMLATNAVRLGDEARAAAAIDQLVRQLDQEPQHARRVALLLAELDELDRAISVLVDRYDGNELAPDVLLVELYRRANEPEKAEGVVEALLAREQLPIDVIRIAADFYGRRDQIDKAEQVLDRLDQTDWPAGIPEFVRASFYASHVGADPAIEQLESAVSEAPERIEFVSTLLNYLLRLNRVDEAVRWAEQATGDAAENPGLQALLANRDLVKAAVDDPRHWPLIEAMLLDASHTEPAVEALRLLVGGDDEAGPDARLQPLRDLAQQTPNFLPLHLVLIQQTLNAGNAAEAADLAEQAMQRFATAVEPAYLAAEAYAAAERWPDALAAAREWRARAGGRAAAADMKIAEAQLALGESEQAVMVTGSYIDRALQNPEANFQLIFKHARGLVASRRHDQAFEVLQPLLSRGPGWRRATLNLAALAIADSRRAERWLQAVEAEATDSLAESADLARGWFALSQRADNQEHLQRALKYIQPVVENAEVTPETLSLAGTMYHAAGEADRAEQLYRRALELNRLHPVPLNNLAMLILERDGDANEALRLAQQALEASPNSASIHDTVALAHRRLGEPSEALRAIRTAVQLQPQTAEWRIALAEMLIESREFTEAREEINELRRSFGFLPPESPVTERINQLEQTLAEAMQAAAN